MGGSEGIHRLVSDLNMTLPRKAQGREGGSTLERAVSVPSIHNGVNFMNECSHSLTVLRAEPRCRVLAGRLHSKPIIMVPDSPTVESAPR